MSSVIKKLIMAVTGFALAAFLLMHMLGNLQALEGGPHAINAYAHFLQTLPWEFLWGFRIGLFACIVVHFGMAALLVLENARARPEKYSVKATIVTSAAARTMIYTGVIILAFAALHVLHYTVLALNPEFETLKWRAESGMYEGKVIHDVYAMLILGFSNDIVALLYIAAMAFIGFHLSHGVSSMFQSVGMRNEFVRYKLNLVAKIYAVVVFGGFSINPAMVLFNKYVQTGVDLVDRFPVAEVIGQYERQAQQGKGKIFVDYGRIEAARHAAREAK